MDRETDIETIRSFGYSVDQVDETVVKIEGHRMLVQIPIDDDEAWAYYASAETHEAHLAALENTASEAAPDETQQMIDQLRSAGYVVLQNA